jgi:hypothetical protein
LLTSSAAAAPSSSLAGALLIAQLAAYLLGGLSLVLPSVARFAPARLGGFFMLVNTSMLVAWAHHFTGRRAVVWEPTRR